MAEPHRFICWEHETDTRSAWYSKPKDGYRAVIKAARAHVERYHRSAPIVSMDVEVYHKGEIQLREFITFENEGY